MEKPNKRFAAVYILDAAYFLDKEYDYYIPAGLAGEIEAGSFVVVPFGGGNRKKAALVRALKDSPSVENTKPVEGLCDYGFTLAERQLGLLMYVKETSFCTVGEALRAMLPPRARRSGERRYSFAADAELDELGEKYTGRSLLVLSRVMRGGSVPYGELAGEFGENIGYVLSSLERDGLIREETGSDGGMAGKTVTIASPGIKAEDYGPELRDKFKLTEKKELVLKALLESGPLPLRELCEQAGVSDSVVRTLAKTGLITLEKIDVTRDRYAFLNEGGVERALSGEQGNAFEKLRSMYAERRPCAAYLYGVTGSGKTRVMLELVKEAVAGGRQAIVLVPEISLTTQTITLFKAHFGARAALYHSSLSEGEKYDAWRGAREGALDVIIGTRSAVFAPFPSLGLIVMDEEQEHTYKSEQNPRYHARDVARFRCAREGAMLLLASATPYVESFYKAKSGTYELVALYGRYGDACLPGVEIVDMNAEEAEGRRSELSAPLIRDIGEALSRGEQAIIFKNRRGYNNFLSCRSCGYVASCPECSVSPKLHTSASTGSGRRTPDRLVCHYCGHSEPVPEKCPSCGGEHLHPMGSGTQKCEDDLAELFPSAAIARLDADSVQGRDSQDEIIGGVLSKDTDILVGTQMVTKGHNFGNVTVVGILNTDQTLYMDDYRANERVFSMLVQTAGRAGRADKRGKAVIQTYFPGHEVIARAREGDYEAFYEKEIALRKACVFPPFCEICLIMLSAEAEADARRAAELAGEEFRALLSEAPDVKVIVFGPVQASLYKLNGRYRMKYIVKCGGGKRARELFARLLAALQKKLPKEIYISVDMNPNNI